MANVNDVKSGFEVLDNGERLQTAVMILACGEESGPLGNDHPGSEQMLLVYAGCVDAEVDGRRFEMRAGESTIVPAGAPHRFVNRSADRAVTFNVYAPKAY